MADMNQIRRNLKAVEQTRQITNAMYLLSTSRMRKAIASVAFNDRYIHRIRATVKDILHKSPNINHKYFQPNTCGNDGFLVIASDKSMCGSYNINVVENAVKAMEHSKDPFVSTVGICTAELLERRNITPDLEWVGAAQHPTLYYARQIGEQLVNFFNNGLVDNVYVVYTHYRGQMSQTPVVRRLLPLSYEDFDDENLEYDYVADMIYDPDPETVFDSLVPQYVIGMVYECLNEACASEHVGRMNAMQSATRNADSMIKKLKFEYNTARQLTITNEITEIAAATEIIGKKSV